jgi:hypothetical protein
VKFTAQRRGTEGPATHPFRKERGKGWGTLLVGQAEKGWATIVVADAEKVLAGPPRSCFISRNIRFAL